MDSLQFQKAEFEHSGVKCAGCSNPVEGSYYHLAGRMICGNCADAVRTRQARPQGSAVLRGFLYGLGAAVACAIGYTTVTLLTGVALALLSIAVGYIVGRAVRRGCGGLGGRRCQILAVALAYFAITISYAPIIVKGFAEVAKKRAEQGKPTPDVQGRLPGVPKPVVLAAGVVAIAGISLAAPFLEVASGVSGIIGLVIVFVGLAQAWKQTARDPRPLTGPFALAEVP